MAKMNLLLLIEHLEEMVDSTFQFAGKVVLDREEMEELIKKLQIALPEEIQQAEWVSREKERYLQQAHEEAKKIIQEAENYAQELVNQDRIMAKAEVEATRVINDAKKTAEEIETEARNYAQSILGRLEESLDRTLRVVREGREGLIDQDEEQS